MRWLSDSLAVSNASGHSHRYYATRQEARDDIIDYIEMFYNSRRKHSYLGYVSPNDYERLALVA